MCATSHPWRSVTARELTDAELDGLTAVLTEAFGEPPEAGAEAVIADWALAQPAAVLEHTRFGAQALRRLGYPHEELLAVLRDLGLGFDPLECEGIDAADLLNLVAKCVSRSLGDPPSH